MIPIKSIGTILFVLFLLSETWARPALKENDDSSSKKCSGKKNLAVYEVGKTYTYSYQSLHNNDIADATEEKSSLKIQASVKISVLSPCEMQLSLTDVKFSDTVESAAGSKSKDYQMGIDMLQKVPIKFSFDNGIVTSVCPDKGENKFAANIKRSIISQLQNSMESLDSSTYVAETDIVGNCLTEYQSIYVADAPFRAITKKKAIAGCSKKHEFSSITNGEPYDMPLDVKKLSLMDGSYECSLRQKYYGNLLESTCKEIHSFNPMQASDDTINMKITTSLVHQKTEDTAADLKSADPEYCSDLSFDHRPMDMSSMSSMTSKAKDLDTVLQSLCTSIKTKQENIPKDFSDLLDLMKSMNVEQLNSLHDKIMKGSCDDDQMKSMFHDSVPLVQTDASIELMMNELKETDQHSINSDTWLASLAFLRKPSLKIIKLSLDGVVKTNNKALIMASNMIKKYCAMDQSCSEKAEIQEFVNYVKSRIVNCDSTDEKSVEDVLSALRAVDNMGGDQAWDKSLSETVLLCSGNIQLQSAALTALQGIQCSKLSMVAIGELFRDKKAANEVRIKAYKILMRCEHLKPVEDFVNDFNADNADSAQVASFVHSHLMNVLQITDSSNVNKQAFIGRIKLAKFGRRAAKSPFSFSQNIKREYKMKNRRGKIEADVIFADETFIPRGLAVNLNMDMWGQKVNVLDLNLRQEGFETYVESLLGPYPRESGEEDQKEKYNKFDSKANKWLNKESDTPKLSIGARVFGNELIFKNNMNMKDMQGNMMTKLMMLQSTGLSGKSSRTTKLIDLGISTPTVSGIPLELKVDGILSTRLEYNLKIQQEMVMKIIPRVALRVVGTFRLNAHCTKIGVQATMTALMDRNVDTKMSMQPKNGGYAISFEQEAVDKRQDFINLKAELAHITKMGIKPLAGKGEQISVNQCTPDVLYEKMDLRYCVIYSHPRADKKQGDPGFPFAGPTNVQIYVEKHSGFSFQMKRELPTEDSEDKLMMVSMGNKKNRESMLLKYQFQKLASGEKTYLWKANGMGGSYEVSGSIDASNKLTGSFKRNDEVTASLNGQYGGGKNNRHFSFQVDKDKAKVASVEYRSKTIEQGKSDHFEADITTYMPMKLTLKRIIKNSKSKGHHKSNQKTMRNYVVDVTLGKTKPHQVKASLNMVNEKNGLVRQQVFKYFWKSGETIFLDVKNDFKIKRSKAKGKEDNSISGKALEIELTHQTKRPEKTIKFTFATSFFVSKHFLRPSLRQPKLFEHSTKITFPDDPTNTLDFNVVAKIKIPQRSVVDVKFASTAVWPKMNIDQNHLLAMNWNLKGNAKTATFELKCQPAKDSLSRIYLQHGAIEQGIQTQLEIAIRSFDLKVNSLFANPKHTLTITRGEMVMVLSSTLVTKNIEATDDRPALQSYDITTEITKNTEPFARQKLEVAYDGMTKQAFKVDYNLRSVEGDGEKLLYKMLIDLYTNLLTKGAQNKNMKGKVEIEIPSINEKKYSFQTSYLCDKNGDKKGQCGKEDTSLILNILKNDQVEKKYGYTQSVERSVGKMGSKSEIFTGDPNSKEEYEFEVEYNEAGYEFEYGVKLTQYGEYKMEGKVTRTNARIDVENKITIKHINADFPYNGVLKETLVADSMNGYKVSYTCEFLPQNGGDDYKLTTNIVISDKQNDWSEIILTLTPNLGQYIGFQKVGLRFLKNRTPSNYNLQIIALYRDLIAKADQSLSFGLDAQVSENYQAAQLSASLNSTIPSTQFKTALVTLGYEASESTFKSITMIGKFDDQFLNFDLTSTPRMNVNGVLSQNLTLALSSSIEAIQKVQSSLAMKLNPQEFLNLILIYNRNNAASMVNSDLSLKWKTNPLSSIDVGVMLGWSANLYGNGKFDFGVVYNRQENSHNVKTTGIIQMNEFNFNSGFSFDINLATTVVMSYNASIQSNSLTFTAIGSGKAINGIPLSSSNEVKLNNEQVALFQFTVLKVLSVEFKLNIGKDMPQLSILIKGNKIESDNLDVEITMSMKPLIKTITQKIAFYNKMGGNEQMDVSGKKASFYFMSETTTEYTDFAKFSISSFITPEMQVFATIECDAPVLGPKLEPTTITVTGITLKESEVSANVNVKGSINYDLSISYSFKSISDMNAALTLTSKDENAPVKSIIATIQIAGYNVVIKVTADSIIGLDITTNGDSWRAMTGDFGMRVMTSEPGYKFDFEFKMPEDPMGDKVFIVNGHYLDTNGKKITFGYDRRLISTASTRVELETKRDLTIVIKYDKSTNIKIVSVLDGGFSSPYLSVTADFNEQPFASLTFDFDTANSNYLLSVSKSETYSGEISYKTIDTGFLFMINSVCQPLPSLTCKLVVDQKLKFTGDTVLDDFLTTVTLESDFLIGLLNNENRQRVIKTNIVSFPMGAAFLINSKLYFYVDNDVQLEITRTAMYGASFSFFPKYADKDKTVLTVNYGMVGEIKTLTVTLTSPYEIVEQLNFVAGYKSIENYYQVTSNFVLNNKNIYDASFDETLKPVDNEPNHRIYKLVMTGYITLTIDQEIRMINPFIASESPLPMFKQVIDADIKIMDRDLKYKRSLLLVNHRNENTYNQQAYYKFENDLRIFALEGQMSPKRNAFELSLDQRKGLTLLFESVPLKYTIKTLVRTIEIDMKGQTFVVNAFKGDKSNTEGLATFTFQLSEPTTPGLIEGTLTSNLFTYVVLVSMQNGEKDMLLTIKQEGKEEPTLRLKYVNDQDFKTYVKGNVEMDLMLTESKQFVKYRGKLAVYKSRKMKISQSLTTQTGSRKFNFVYDPWRQFLITDNDLYRLELFYNRDYKGVTNKAIALYKPLGLTYRRITTFTYSPWRFAHVVNTDLGDIKFYLRALSSRSCNMELIRVKKTGEVVTDLSWNGQLNDKNVLVSRLTTSPNLIQDYKETLAEVYNPSRFVKIRDVLFDDIAKANGKLFSEFSNPLVGQEKLLQHAMTVYADYSAINSIVLRMYANDEFMMRTIWTMMQPVLNSISSKMNTLTSAFSSYAQSGGFYGKLYSLGSMIVSSIPNDLHVRFLQFDYMVTNKVITFFYQSCTKMAELASSGTGKVKSFLSVVMEKMQFLKDRKMPEWMVEHKAYIVKNYQNALAELSEEDFKEFYETEMTPTMNRYKELREGMSNMRKNVRNLGKWMRGYVSQRSGRKAMKERKRMLMKLIVNGEFSKLVSELLKPELFKIEFDPQGVTYNTEIYMSRSLMKYTRMAIKIKMRIAKRLVKTASKFQGGLVANAYYKVRYYMSNYGSKKKIIENLLPPYKQQAWLILSKNGEQNYAEVISYSGRIKGTLPQFGSECNILLTRNVVSKDFTVIYSNSDSSVLVQNPSSEAEIKIGLDGKVYFLNNAISLPKKINNLLVTRDGQLIRVSHIKSGAIVDVYTKLKTIKVEVPGLWHGQMVGLMGVNDYNMFRDTYSPSGESQTESFDPWALSDGCQTQDQSTNQMEEFTPQQLKGVVASVGRCFPVVNPRPYLSAGKRMASAGSSYSDPQEKLKKACPIINAYSLRCREVGVTVYSPAMCNEECGTTQTKKEKEGLKSMLYIFAIEESSCAMKYMQQFKDLVATLTERRSNDKFSLITFKGNRKGSSTYTDSNGKDVFTKDELLKNLDLLDLSGDAYKGTGSVEALYNALMFPIARGRMHSVYMFACDKCMPHPSYSSAVLMGLMRRKKINVQYFSAHHFQDDDVIGVGPNVAYKVVKNKVVKDPKTYGLNMGRDACTAVARTVGDGIAWSLKAIKKSKVESSDVYKNVLNASIGSEFYKTYSNQPQQCSCIRDPYGSMQESCNF